MKKNKGYTLVEMLIVIAIMAIVSGMAFVTIGIVYQAKYNAAIDTLNSQMDSLWIKTKALSQGKVQVDGADQISDKTKVEAVYPLCMRIKENTADDDVRDGSYEVSIGYYDVSKDKFVEKEKVATLTDIININYNAAKDEQKHPKNATPTKANGDTYSSTSEVYIEFNKSDGSVRYGAGTYEIIFNDRVVGTVYLDAMTGNHYAK